YTVIGIIGFVASLSVATAPLRPRLRTIVTTVFCLTFIWADIQWFFAPRFRKDDSRAAVAWLGKHLPRGAVVAVAPKYAVGALAHYAAQSREHLCLRGVVTQSDISRNGTPDALVLTRLYHVDNWQALETEFTRLSGSSTERGSEIGFRILVRKPAQPR